MQDLGIIIPMIPFLHEIQTEKKKSGKKQFKSIFYFPIDFNITPNLLTGINFFDVLCTYTEYGRQVVLGISPSLRPKLRVMPHGNSPENFYTLPKTEAEGFRKEYFGENAGKFIVANINRNQPRKDIPTTIFGFWEYWETYNKNSLLYLHMNPKDPIGWDLEYIIKQTALVLGKDVMFPSEEDYNKGADVSKLNKIYNSIDAFMTTCTGEGW
jgi:hypothetical protein